MFHSIIGRWDREEMAYEKMIYLLSMCYQLPTHQIRDLFQHFCRLPHSQLYSWRENGRRALWGTPAWIDLMERSEVKEQE